MGTLERFGKGENMGSTILGKERTPAEFLFFAGSVPDFFTCAIAFASQTNTKKVSTFIPTVHVIKLRLREVKQLAQDCVASNSRARI